MEIESGMVAVEVETAYGGRRVPADLRGSAMLAHREPIDDQAGDEGNAGSSGFSG